MSRRVLYILEFLIEAFIKMHKHEEYIALIYFAEMQLDQLKEEEA
jgi:hypothetical protein